MKIIKARWIGGRTTIGVVCIENSIGQRTVRIATIHHPTTSAADSRFVAEWGAKLTFEESKGFFPDLITAENFKMEDDQ